MDRTHVTPRRIVGRFPFLHAMISLSRHRRVSASTRSPLRLLRCATLALGAFLAGRDAIAQTTYSANTTISANRTVNGILVNNNATLTINNGATLTSNGNVQFASPSNGSLQIENGGALKVTGTTYLGFTSGRTTVARVTGSGSQLSSSSALYLANRGTGTLTLSQGGTVAVNNGTGVVTAAGLSGSTGTLNIGAAANATAAAAGIVNAASVANGSGTGTLQFNTTGTTYFTKDGTSSGTGVTTSGALKLVVTAGANVFSGSLAHTGATTLNGGTTFLNGSLTASAVTVNSGATLAGSGTIGGLTTIASGGTLAPGNSPGTLTFTNGLTLNDGAALDFQLGTTSDLLRVSGGTLTGSASAGGITLNLSDAGGFAPATYTLFDFSGASTSSFNLSDFTFGSTIGGYTYSLDFVGDTLQLTASAIPEPSTYAALFGACALALVTLRRRRRNVA